MYLEHMSRDTVDVAKSHQNWMNFKGAFQDNDFSPFSFKYVKLVSSLKDYKQEMESQKSRIIITSSASLE